MELQRGKGKYPIPFTEMTFYVHYIWYAFDKTET